MHFMCKKLITYTSHVNLSYKWSAVYTAKWCFRSICLGSLFLKQHVLVLLLRRGHVFGYIWGCALFSLIVFFSEERRMDKPLFWSLWTSAHSICLRPKELCQSNCLHLFLSVFSNSTVAWESNWNTLNWNWGRNCSHPQVNDASWDSWKWHSWGSLH